MAVVAVLRKAQTGGIAIPIPGKARLLLWALAILDVMTVAWMLSAGDWLDQSSLVTEVVTLGGHHLIVLWLAVAGFALVAAATLLTKALTEIHRLHLIVGVLGALASVVALGGVLSVAILVVGTVALVGMVGVAMLGGRFVFLSGTLGRR